MSAVASKRWAEPFSACTRSSRPWLIVAICFVLASAMFGCSAQHALETQNVSPAPALSAPPVPQRGRLEVASWYGPGFVGRVTSDGETYNPEELTAASKTLPIGSRVRVTNTYNGRSVVVRINDRGPYVRGRSLDLSRGAARRIGLIKRGVCRVRVRVVRGTSYGRATPVDSAPPDASRGYIRRTAYHQRRHGSSRTSAVKNDRSKRATTDFSP